MAADTFTQRVERRRVATCQIKAASPARAHARAAMSVTTMFGRGRIRPHPAMVRSEQAHGETRTSSKATRATFTVALHSGRNLAMSDVPYRADAESPVRGTPYATPGERMVGSWAAFESVLLNLADSEDYALLAASLYDYASKLEHEAAADEDERVAYNGPGVPRAMGRVCGRPRHRCGR